MATLYHYTRAIRNTQSKVTITLSQQKTRQEADHKWPDASGWVPFTAQMRAREEVEGPFFG